jgi:hypothetical protein
MRLRAVPLEDGEDIIQTQILASATHQSVLSRGSRHTLTALPQVARALSVDVTKGVPTAPFQRPKGAIWSDKQGHEHETAAVKARMELYTGDSSSRIPPDPYAPPHVTPAQVRNQHPYPHRRGVAAPLLVVPPCHLKVQRLGIRWKQTVANEDSRPNAGTEPQAVWHPEGLGLGDEGYPAKVEYKRVREHRLWLSHLPHAFSKTASPVPAPAQHTHTHTRIHASSPSAFILLCPDAPVRLPAAISEVTARAKTQEEAACFSRMLRRWNDQAYAGVDKEEAKRIEMREVRSCNFGVVFVICFRPCSKK